VRVAAAEAGLIQYRPERDGTPRSLLRKVVYHVATENKATRALPVSCPRHESAYAKSDYGIQSSLVDTDLSSVGHVLDWRLLTLSSHCSSISFDFFHYDVLSFQPLTTSRTSSPHGGHVTPPPARFISRRRER